MNRAALPSLFRSLKCYSAKIFLADLIAGVTVGLVALPLAMAFAIASGATPQSGLYCGVVAGFLVSALGGSRTQIGGPTGAYVVIVSGIIAQHGFDGLLVCTLLAGAMLVVLGLTGLGSAVRFIPSPVVVGFTNGIAVLIASTQFKDFLGLRVDTVPGDFPGRCRVLWANLGSYSIATALLGVAALLVMILCRRLNSRIPGSIVALVLGTLVAHFAGFPVETIGSRFGGIPSSLPNIAFPHLELKLIPTLMSPALSVALLGAIESLMSAVVADRMTGDQHNPNVELVAQGIANLAVPFVGGIPATGAIARTATNIRTGARTPIAGMIHALTLLAVLLFAAPLASHIPLTVLAAILLVVAYNMGEWREVPWLLRMSRPTIAVWLSTFLLTVFVDLTVAVQIGMVLAALFFIHKVARTTSVALVTDDYIEEGRLHILQDREIPDYVSVIRIHGPFLFGTTEQLSAATEPIDRLRQVVILRLRNMTALDATGVMALEEFACRLRVAGRALILCGARPQPARLIRQSGLERTIRPENICPHIAAALERVKVVRSQHLSLQILEPNAC